MLLAQSQPAARFQPQLGMAITITTTIIATTVIIIPIIIATSPTILATTITITTAGIARSEAASTAAFCLLVNVYFEEEVTDARPPKRIAVNIARLPDAIGGRRRPEPGCLHRQP